MLIFKAGSTRVPVLNTGIPFFSSFVSAESCCSINVVELMLLMHFGVKKSRVVGEENNELVRVLQPKLRCVDGDYGPVRCWEPRVH